MDRLRQGTYRRGDTYSGPGRHANAATRGLTERLVSAMTDHPAQPPGAAREVVRCDAGGWISGPSFSSDPVVAGHVMAGDVLLIDGTRAEVTDVRRGEYRLESGHAPGVALGWRSGSSSGVMFRDAADLLDRITP